MNKHIRNLFVSLWIINPRKEKECETHTYILKEQTNNKSIRFCVKCGYVKEIYKLTTCLCVNRTINKEHTAEQCNSCGFIYYKK